MSSKVLRRRVSYWRDPSAARSIASGVFFQIPSTVTTVASLMNEIMAALVTFCGLGPDLFHPIFFYPMVLTSVLGASIRLVGLLLRFLFLLLTEKNCCLVIMLTRKVFQAYI